MPALYNGVSLGTYSIYLIYSTYLIPAELVSHSLHATELAAPRFLIITKGTSNST